MRILYCLDGTYNSGGKERIIIGKANQLAKMGYEVAILTSEQMGKGDFFSLEGVKRYDSDVNFSETNTSNILSKTIKTLQKRKQYHTYLKAITEEFRPDVIISTFGYEIGVVANFSFKGKKILESHFAKNFRLQRNRKGVWGLIDRYKTKQDERYVGKYDKFVCLTKESLNHWKAYTKDLTVISNFIEKRTTTPAKLKNKKVIAVGRLTHLKGYDRMIKAWGMVTSLHPDWILEIYGEGELREELQSQINDNSLSERIKLQGALKDIHSKYLESSIFVMTSHAEGFGIVIVEAMEAGLPIVSFDFPCGPKDLVKNGENGILVRNGDIDGLAEAIIKLIKSEELRVRMGREAYNNSKQYYQEEIMGQWDQLFKSLQ